jgi:hypothetical protein
MTKENKKILTELFERENYGNLFKKFLISTLICLAIVMAASIVMTTPVSHSFPNEVSVTIITILIIALFGTITLVPITVGAYHNNKK